VHGHPAFLARKPIALGIVSAAYGTRQNLGLRDFGGRWRSRWLLRYYLFLLACCNNTSGI
jgi:hypothetical protein